MAPWKLIFGMQLAFDLTKRNIEREKLDVIAFCQAFFFFCSITIILAQVGDLGTRKQYYFDKHPWVFGEIVCVTNINI